MVALATLPAGCGGDRPTDPAPAPLPFRPRSIEIALGQSGSTLTLMTAEGGRFTRDGEEFRGGRVQARNGNWYELTLADGEWLAAFVPPEPVVVALGPTGTALTLHRFEDLSWRVSDGGREATVESGDLVTTEAGANYRLALADGHWTATFEPMRVEVTLGDSGSSINLEQGPDGAWRLGDVTVPNGLLVTTPLRTTYRLELASGRWSASFEPMQAVVPLGESDASVILEQGEDGFWRLGENIVQSGHRVTTEARTTYRLILDSGLWTAIFDPRRIVIRLGNSETTVTATQAQDGSYRIDGAILAEGLVHRVGSTGATYVISMAEDGGWTASYRPTEQGLRLSGRGLVTLVRDEGGTWWLDDRPVETGDLVTTETGKTYLLELAGNAWTAIFQPAATPIHGTGLVALSTETDRSYRVGESARLPASGEGDVEVGGAFYHVWPEDGDLHGARFDREPHGRSVGEGNFHLGLVSGAAGLGQDKPNTRENEAGTTLLVAGTEFSVGELLSTGTATVPGPLISESVATKIARLRRQAEVLVDVLDEERVLLQAQLRRIWDRAQTEVDRIFGPGEVRLKRELRIARVVAGLQAVEAAMSSGTAFEEATAYGQQGLFREAALGPGEAAEVFGALEWTAKAVLAVTGGTRYGAVRKMVRRDGIAAAGLVLDAAGAEAGAFAYSTVADTLRTRDISHTGTAGYAGGVAAVSGGGTLYTGEIELLVDFNRESVSGMVWNLADPQGQPWWYQFQQVDRIILPAASLGTRAYWARTKGFEAGAQILYRFPFRGPEFVTSTFEGHLLGLGEEAGSEAVGVWSVGEEGRWGSYLAGGFGATRTDARTPPGQGTDPEAGPLAYGVRPTDNPDLAGAAAAGAIPTTWGTQPGWDPPAPLAGLDALSLVDVTGDHIANSSALSAQDGPGIVGRGEQHGRH